VGKPGMSSRYRVSICTGRIGSECGGGRLHASYLLFGVGSGHFFMAPDAIDLAPI
jgi:hypothetical protein